MLYKEIVGIVAYMFICSYKMFPLFPRNMPLVFWKGLKLANFADCTCILCHIGLLESRRLGVFLWAIKGSSILLELQLHHFMRKWPCHTERDGLFSSQLLRHYGLRNYKWAVSHKNVLNVLSWCPALDSTPTQLRKPGKPGELIACGVLSIDVGVIPKELKQGQECMAPPILLLVWHRLRILGTFLLEKLHSPCSTWLSSDSQMDYIQMSKSIICLGHIRKEKLEDTWSFHTQNMWNII